MKLTPYARRFARDMAHKAPEPALARAFDHALCIAYGALLGFILGRVVATWL